MNGMKLKSRGCGSTLCFETSRYLEGPPETETCRRTGPPLDSGPPFLMCFGHNRNRATFHPLGNLGIDVQTYPRYLNRLVKMNTKGMI